MEDMKLYDYTSSYQNVINLINEEEGVTYEDVKDTLDAIADNAEDKIANTGKVIQKLEDDLEAIKNRESQVKELKAKKIKQIQQLKDYLLINMQALNKKKVQTPTITVSTRKSESLHIYDENALPEEFIKVETVKKADKAGFKKYYKNLQPEEAEKIKYATLVQNQSISIK